MKKMNKEQFIEAVKKDPSLLLYHPEQVSYDNQGYDVYYYDACKDPFTYQEAKELFDTYFIGKRVSAKMPYASRTETPPHKTGVPKEWLDALENGIELDKTTPICQGTTAHSAPPALDRIFGRERAHRMNQEFIYRRDKR